MWHFYFRLDHVMVLLVSIPKDIGDLSEISFWLTEFVVRAPLPLFLLITTFVHSILYDHLQHQPTAIRSHLTGIGHTRCNVGQQGAIVSQPLSACRRVSKFESRVGRCYAAVSGSSFISAGRSMVMQGCEIVKTMGVGSLGDMSSCA